MYEIKVSQSLAKINIYYLHQNLKYQLSLKYKNMLISLKNYSLFFADDRKNFRKTAVRQQSILDMHGKGSKLQEESIMNASGKKLKINTCTCPTRVGNVKKWFL